MTLPEDAEDVPLSAKRKQCPNCGEDLDVTRFSRNSQARDGLQSVCKSCQRYGHRKRRYGLSREEADKLDEQPTCAICGADDPEHIDHDHATEAVREKLCENCNKGLGMFQDDPQRLRSAADYIEMHDERQYYNYTLAPHGPGSIDPDHDDGSEATLLEP